MRRNFFYQLLFIVVALLPLQGFTQLTGSLHLMKDNFYTQLMNPSYYSTRNKIVLGLPGLAGGSVHSSGNFRFSDIVVRNNSGRYTLLGMRFAETGNDVNKISQSADIPLFFITLPIVDGALTVYWNEHIRTGMALPVSSVSWLKHDNLDEPYQQFNSGNNGLGGYWNHELGLGIAQRISERLVLGGRIKFLFNEIFAETKNWNYTIFTGAEGKELKVLTEGEGYVSGPLQLRRDGQHRVEHLRIGKEKYSFPGNPGVAVDLGFTLNIDPANTFAASIRNLGYIWLRHKTFHVHQDEEYIFSGMDFTHSIEPNSEGYVSTFDVMKNTKRELRNVFRPVADAEKALRGITPEIYLHYEHRFSGKFYAGATNHTVFHREFQWNTLSVSGIRKTALLDFTAGLTLNPTQTITAGGGVQWRNSFSRLFVMSDNLLSIYHPAAHKTFSLTFGIHLMLNNENRQKLWNIKSSDQPFYKKEPREEDEF